MWTEAAWPAGLRKTITFTFTGQDASLSPLSGLSCWAVRGCGGLQGFSDRAGRTTVHDEHHGIKEGWAARRGRARMQRATDPAVHWAREVRRPPYVPRAAALRPLLLQARPATPSLLRSVGTPLPLLQRAEWVAECAVWCTISLAVAFGQVSDDHACAMHVHIC